MPFPHSELPPEILQLQYRDIKPEDYETLMQLHGKSLRGKGTLPQDALPYLPCQIVDEDFLLVVVMSLPYVAGDGNRTSSRGYRLPLRVLRQTWYSSSLFVCFVSPPNARQDNDLCPICQCTFSLDNEVRLLPCSHWFHKVCRSTIRNHAPALYCSSSLFASSTVAERTPTGLYRHLAL